MQLDLVITPAVLSLLKPVIDSHPGSADTFACEESSDVIVTCLPEHLNAY